MPDNMDDAKGQVKEKVGDATGDDDMKSEGKKDQAAGKVKEGADKVKDTADDAVDKVKDKL